MKVHRNAVLGFALACSVPAAAHAQAAPATLDAVVAEMRLLRQALERQGAATARAQVLIARLTLQDQRTARARQAVERLEAELASAEREHDDLQGRARELTRALEQLTNEDVRPQLEAESRTIRARMTDVQAQRTRTEARLGEARQALHLEGGRYDDLERSLAELDRQLQPAQ